eukprot:GHVR01138131.1.p1 GENE.GHVR01138131.1~~GHVR01138131.1.p1  ORF type:complete len:102 (+),score=4.40 GHVR01138131.1:144-449(+)
MLHLRRIVRSGGSIANEVISVFYEYRYYTRATTFLTHAILEYFCSHSQSYSFSVSSAGFRQVGSVAGWVLGESLHGEHEVCVGMFGTCYNEVFELVTKYLS